MAAIITVGIISLVGLTVFLMLPRTPKPSHVFSSVADLEEYFAQAAAAGRAPGLSVAVVKEGELVYSNGFGQADGLKQIPATQDTVYHWWSMTKIVTAVAVLQLHEQELLNIADPVIEYLPYFQVTYQGVEQSDLSIRQLLNHSSGLPNGIPDLLTWVHLEGEPGSNQTELLINKLPDFNQLLFLPGEKTSYSNFGYIPLGAIIEAVSGLTYEDYIRQNVLEPLGMAATDFIYTKEMAENEAIGSQHILDPFTPLFPFMKLSFIINERDGMRLWFHRIYTDQTPPTGLIGPVTDVGQFMLAYLNDGGEILDPASVDLMNQDLLRISEPGESAQGLGWRAQFTHDGRRYLSHGGGGPGFATVFRVYPLEELGVVVMGNDSTINRDRLADVLANMDWRNPITGSAKTDQ